MFLSLPQTLCEKLRTASPHYCGFAPAPRLWGASALKFDLSAGRGHRSMCVCNTRERSHAVGERGGRSQRGVRHAVSRCDNLCNAWPLRGPLPRRMRWWHHRRCRPQRLLSAAHRHASSKGRMLPPCLKRRQCEYSGHQFDPAVDRAAWWMPGRRRRAPMRVGHTTAVHCQLQWPRTSLVGKRWSTRRLRRLWWWRW